MVYTGHRSIAGKDPQPINLQSVPFPVWIFPALGSVPGTPPGYRSRHASPLEQRCVASPVPGVCIATRLSAKQYFTVSHLSIEF